MFVLFLFSLISANNFTYILFTEIYQNSNKYHAFYHKTKQKNCLPVHYFDLSIIALFFLKIFGNFCKNKYCLLLKETKNMLFLEIAIISFKNNVLMYHHRCNNDLMFSFVKFSTLSLVRSGITITL